MKVQRSTGYETMVDSAGNVHQAGIPSDPLNRHYPLNLVDRAPIEAVVESTHYADEDDRNRVTKSNQRAVLVNVRLLGVFGRHQISWVPVLQRTQGLWDEDVYIPRPSRQNLDGATMSTGSAAKGDVSPTPAESLDGDRGLIFFLESNPNSPVFLPYSQGHPRTNNPRKKADGRVRRIRHAGVLMSWSEGGNWTLDASGACKEELGAKGIETPNNGTGGVVMLKTKDGAGAALYLELDAAGKVSLQAGGGTEVLTLTKATHQAELKAATKAIINSPLVELGTAPLEPVLKGTTYVAAETTLYAFLTAYFAAVKPIWDIIAQSGAPSKISLATGAASAAAAWAGGLVTWLTNANLAQSLKVKTG